MMTDELKSDCLQAQIDEVEVLQSIYGNAFKCDSDSSLSYSMDLEEQGNTVTLHLTLPLDYPLQSPPIYTISAPNLSTIQKNKLAANLNEEYLANIGSSVLYQWIECIKDFLIEVSIKVDDGVDGDLVHAIEEELNVSESLEIPNIIHGDTITDRKSVFQPHLARVFSTQQVKQVIEELKSNKKIAHATHNIYAYRISLANSSFAQDFDDDGETQAGGRMLHLLQILNVENVVVVVSRWYGGVHLGPDRFRHINNATRAVLDQAGLLK